MVCRTVTIDILFIIKIYMYSWCEKNRMGAGKPLALVPERVWTILPLPAVTAVLETSPSPFLSDSALRGPAFALQQPWLLLSVCLWTWLSSWAHRCFFAHGLHTLRGLRAQLTAEIFTTPGKGEKKGVGGGSDWRNFSLGACPFSWNVGEHIHLKNLF